MKKVRYYRVETTAFHAHEMCRYEGSRIISQEHEYYIGPEWCLYEEDADTNPYSARNAYTRYDFVIEGVPCMGRWHSFGFHPTVIA